MSLAATCDELERLLSAVHHCLADQRGIDVINELGRGYRNALVRLGKLQIARAQIEFVSGVRLDGEYHPEDIEASLLDRFFDLKRRAGHG